MEELIIGIVGSLVLAILTGVVHVTWQFVANTVAFRHRTRIELNNLADLLERGKIRLELVETKVEDMDVLVDKIHERQNIQIGFLKANQILKVDPCAGFKEE